MTGKYATGDHISFTYKGERLEGTIVNSKGDDKSAELTIKLTSGYNIIVLEKDLERVEKLPTIEKKKVEKSGEVKKDPNLPTIALLHTGGTVASKVDYATGAVSAKFSPEEIIELFPELSRIANIKSKLVSNMMSEMMRFAHWNILARAVEEEIAKGVDGIIITHGTDIIHMTSAALAFILENCPIPVLFVGSQRSSDRPSSDAASNLICAATFIAHQVEKKCGFRGIGLCMHEGIEKDDCVIWHPCRVRKMHTSRRDAFQGINDTPLARVTYPGLHVEKLQNYKEALQLGDGKPLRKEFNEQLKVGLCAVHPQMFAEELGVYDGFDGLVLELTGLGHGPTMKTDDASEENEKIATALAKIAERVPVAAAPRTIYGRLNMHVYTPGRQLIEMGVLGQGLDMTPETAFVKLAWLLSNYKTEAREMYAQSLRGEISAQIAEKEFVSE